MEILFKLDPKFVTLDDGRPARIWNNTAIIKGTCDECIIELKKRLSEYEITPYRNMDIDGIAYLPRGTLAKYHNSDLSESINESFYFMCGFDDIDDLRKRSEKVKKNNETL